MSDVDIRFEREEREGIVAVGTYLIDAMKRFGIRPEACIPPDEHFCAVVVTKGAELFSPQTETETKYFEVNEQAAGERLACQTLIERAGEITVMTKEKQEEKAEAEAESAADFKKEFAEMPLEKKIANLVQLEAIALGDTFSFIANSPYLIFEKIGDIMAEFGKKLEKESKAATRPKEHVEKESSDEPVEAEPEAVEPETPTDEDTVPSEEHKN